MHGSGVACRDPKGALDPFQMELPTAVSLTAKPSLQPHQFFLTMDSYRTDFLKFILEK